MGMGIIRSDPVTLVTLNTPLNFSGNYDAAKMWLSALVFLVTAVMAAAKIPGAPMCGILLGTIVVWSECWASKANDASDSVFLYPFGKCDGGFDPSGNVSLSECYCYAPTKVAELARIENTAGAFGWSSLNSEVFWIATITFFYNDVIGCGATLYSVARKAKYLDENGEKACSLPPMRFDSIH